MPPYSTFSTTSCTSPPSPLNVFSSACTVHPIMLAIGADLPRVGVSLQGVGAEKSTWPQQQTKHIATPGNIRVTHVRHNLAICTACTHPHTTVQWHDVFVWGVAVHHISNMHCATIASSWISVIMCCRCVLKMQKYIYIYIYIYD